MKKNNILVILSVLLFCFSLPVNAQDYNTGTLIPVDTNASVTTESFKYDFIANSFVNEKGFSVINFSNIQNLTSEVKPVSINILLFDAESKNIGFLTYCSEKDVSTDYANYKLNANANTSYYINVVSRYFVNGKTPHDVRYVSVLDDNKYCHIGGYDKYAGLSIEEINNGVYNMTDNQKASELFSLLKNNLFMIISIVLFVGIGILFIEGLFLNTLHRKIYNTGSALAFIPIANTYLSVKLAFGSLIAKIYIIGFILSMFLGAFLPIVPAVIGGLGGISFLVVLIKLLTKNYDLFTGNVSNGNGSVPKKKDKTVIEETLPPPVPTVEEVIADNKEEALDLSYGNSSTSFMSQSNETQTEPVTSSSDLGGMFDAPNIASNNVQDGDKFEDINPPTQNASNENNFINFNMGNSSNVDKPDEQKNNKEGESELSKFFE